MPRLAQQYALPAHDETLRRDSSGSSHNSGEETPRMENTLRRKTPNGTLNAGYDGHLDYQHPQKYQLMVGEDLGQQALNVPSTSSKRTFLEHQQQQHIVHSSWASPADLGWLAGQDPQACSLPMDSVLDHAHQFYGQTVPSVIQPSFQYVGPTASGGQVSGPWGPYWHDGTFVPYRPTVVRDPRFYHHSSGMWPLQARSLQLPQRQQQQWRQQQGMAHAHVYGTTAHTAARYGYFTPSQTPGSLYVALPHADPGQRIESTSFGHLSNSQPDLTANEEFGPESANGRRSSVVPIMSQPPMDNSPPSRAALALSYIEEHCRETEWQWTDGMHLGGCLAYGLGNYQKALRWYTKVLEMDPKHLEARSNYAATLLAVGRKQEAEEHWMGVVETAPNHFEAVEHLVGLLCGDHRSEDAVKVIEHVERVLRQARPAEPPRTSDRQSECSSSTASRSPCMSELSDRISYDFEADKDCSASDVRDNPASAEPGFGTSGFAIPASENGRMLALIHAKGNMMYNLDNHAGAAHAFEDAVMIATGRRFGTIEGLVKHILIVVSFPAHHSTPRDLSAEPILLAPTQALKTAQLCFPQTGELPCLQYIQGGLQSIARRAVISTTSNSLLSLAKIYQDGMANASRANGVPPLPCGVRDILALYYLSLSLQPSPSTANNVGILLAGVQQVATPLYAAEKLDIPGVLPGSGVALALQYYNYGLQLDQRHAHLYTNLGSLLKDIGQLDAAINMYDRAVRCDNKFDIALANLANAVKDKGRISEAIGYYQRAVEVSPDFAEAVCGLANALNSVCGWKGRGGIAAEGGKRDRWHVDPNGMLLDARQPGASSSGWIKRVVDIVEKQLTDGESWGRGILTPALIEELVQQMVILDGPDADVKHREAGLRSMLNSWAGMKWEGARLTRLVERATRRIGWHWYRDLYVEKKRRTESSYNRPQLPAALTVPTAPTVLPFHTFTCPVSAKQIRLISQRNGLRISVNALRAPWLPKQVYPPPAPPAPYLKVGYLSSDFNNHPLAHLMQSVFGLHHRERVEAYCYATTASDKSAHREQIEREAPVFRDVTTWSLEKIVNQIVRDGIHILVNLNGYTRGARNEVFAARPAPIQMSFMGFAGTLGAEWCDYLMADTTAIPPETLRPWRRNVDLEDQQVDENSGSDDEWVYGENIIYCRDTFFCCDHKQSASATHDKRLSWEDEQKERWRMRKELFPQILDETIIFGNFNQLYKIDPTTFRTWLRVLAAVPNSILWLLRFPDLGESHLMATARLWATTEVASRLIFTDVAPKHLHISRARICDLFLDTAECNAHTTAADVLWSGTPLLTLPRYSYKMCSRMAASILRGALPKTGEGVQAARELIATDEDDYESKAIALGKSLTYSTNCDGSGSGRLMRLREMLYEERWTSALFDTRRWVRDLEDAYEVTWARYVKGEGGDIWLDDLGGTH
ncbi:glycosyltransferase family 41 protein [Baudoinia panamericana UAMH 10762]|uniref:protein O-GlcNAc transferase n=1 Tax=Baudoinia panamericana (strain UAMH 10762) TaxID=717646 RepID=M2NCP0_BAUPA|nr:glycosyltransferase family 41 protein [Baudoinia panamericana UAMH 10762]EMC96670.1 glycosyltransferase family 41 protein [Baudoinia panamericana UAMH 10762]